MDKLLSGRRVLVLEDEMMVLMMVEDMLSDLGCESVSTAATVEQALALVHSQTFDVAMLDMNVAGIKSHSVADALTERGIPFAFATGYNGHDMREGYRQVPMLNKPFHFDAVKSALSKLISR